MRIVLRFFEFEIPSIESLQLSDKMRLLNIWSAIKELSSVSGIMFFGSSNKLTKIENVDYLVKEFAKKKVERYAFCDVKDLSKFLPQIHWDIGIRKKLFTVSLVCHSTIEKMESLISEIVEVNHILLTSIVWNQILFPFSYLELPDINFELPRPPRNFGRFSKNSLVDIFHLKSSFRDEELKIIHELQQGSLIEGSDRIITGDMLIVSWGKHKKHTLESILAKRYLWYAEHGNLPIDSSFNMLGDKEFALWDAKPTKELTFYSPFNRKGCKAVVFDNIEQITKLVYSLNNMLKSGKTIEGYPIEGITMITPSRESAIALYPVASQYGMNVVYVGVDNKLWDPFPTHYETNAP